MEFATCPEEYFQRFFFKSKTLQLYSDLRQKYSAGLLRLHSTCSEIFGNIKNTNLQFFRTLNENFSDFDKKIFGMVVKTAFYVTRGTFWVTFFKREPAHSE